MHALNNNSNKGSFWAFNCLKSQRSSLPAKRIAREALIIKRMWSEAMEKRWQEKILNRNKVDADPENTN